MFVVLHLIIQIKTTGKGAEGSHFTNLSPLTINPESLDDLSKATSPRIDADLAEAHAYLFL
jgi:hypothetical protein